MQPRRQGHKDLDFGDFPNPFDRDGPGEDDLGLKDKEMTTLPPFQAKSTDEERIPFYELDLAQMNKAINPGLEEKSKKGSKK